ncbi:Pyrophosphate--fructose 6-phosphate 1-phosphotransferase subunit beta [Glycine max]|nr:Pyrophosphate--fructose 6-phosphate 1-phosphotransferase subunit beta [Glycine max]
MPVCVSSSAPSKVLDPEVAVNKEEYQRGDEKEAAAGEEVIVVVVGEEVAECVDPAKKKELDGLCAEMPVALAECVEIAKLFPNLFGQPSTALVPSDSHTPPVNQKLKIGVVLSGGQAPGGHNVISGIFDYLQDLVEGSTLYGFRGGPTGIMKCKYVELTSDYIYPYRNQFKQAEETVQKLDLDGLVVIGGDDSNTNACLLACLHGEEEKLNLLLSSFASHFTPKLSNSRVYADS